MAAARKENGLQMSAMKERRLVWEERDKAGVMRLKFIRPEPNAELVAIAREPLLEGEALRKHVAKLAGKNERIHHYGGAMKLAENAHLKQPYVDLSPRQWLKVAISELDGGLKLVHCGSRIDFLPGDRKILGFPDDLATENLSMEQAIANGNRIEQLFKLKKL